MPQAEPHATTTESRRAVRPHLAADVRHQLEEEIELRIAILDALDGDSDLEPSLGAPEALVPPPGWGLIDTRADQTCWADGCHDDREQDAGDDREPDDGETDSRDLPRGLDAASLAQWRSVPREEWCRTSWSIRRRRARP